ncbi:MAG: isochorismatase family protein [Nitriliruptorales bacterium]
MSAQAELDPLGTYGQGTVLIVVDVQNDFADPEGSLYVPGGDAAIIQINAEILAARQEGCPVVYTQDWHPESTPHFDKDGGIWPVHCVKETWGAELHPDLRVSGPIVRKGSEGGDGYSGFYVRDPESGDEEETELEAILKDAGVERTVVIGLALDYCVKETVLDAARKGYDPTLLTAATAAVNLQEGDGDRALKEMEEAGATLR